MGMEGGEVDHVQLEPADATAGIMMIPMEMAAAMSFLIWFSLFFVMDSLYRFSVVKLSKLSGPAGRNKPQ